MDSLSHRWDTRYCSPVGTSNKPICTGIARLPSFLILLNLVIFHLANDGRYLARNLSVVTPIGLLAGSGGAALGGVGADTGRGGGSLRPR